MGGNLPPLEEQGHAHLGLAKEKVASLEEYFKMELEKSLSSLGAAELGARIFSSSPSSQEDLCLHFFVFLFI